MSFLCTCKYMYICSYGRVNWTGAKGWSSNVYVWFVRPTTVPPYVHMSSYLYVWIGLMRKVGAHMHDASDSCDRLRRRRTFVRQSPNMSSKVASDRTTIYKISNACANKGSFLGCYEEWGCAPVPYHSLHVFLHAGASPPLTPDEASPGPHATYLPASAVPV